MDPTYKLCDICGKRSEEDHRIWVATGSSPCPAGGSSEEDGEYVDLCPAHQAEALLVLLRDPTHPRRKNHEMGKRLVTWVRERKPQ